IRPADAAETAYAWKVALGRTEGPTALILTRQDVPAIDRSVCASARGLESGGYILWESGSKILELILIATGSELGIALDAARELARRKLSVRVVSMPCWEIFDAQCKEYRDKVLPPEVRARVAVEAGLRLGWEHYVGLEGAVVGLDGFGASAPASVLFKEFGVTLDAVVDVSLGLVKKRKKR
ncbi:MAG TPA: transketolase C-terminal domain-containing protein, partial [Deltaproteobacteria bacterium]|nr:transketolase C-terminal domain-containing protein [Deltaproteobacteria bacterium]